jgi:hypothetical protein
VADTAVRRWVGSGNVPGHLGIWGASGPLVVMEVAGLWVTVRSRPKFLAWLAGVVPLVAEPGSGLVVAAQRGTWGWGWFIDFRLPGGRPYRLWTRSREEAQSVLSWLADAGFDVPVVESR